MVLELCGLEIFRKSKMAAKPCDLRPPFFTCIVSIYSGIFHVNFFKIGEVVFKLANICNWWEIKMAATCLIFT